MERVGELARRVMFLFRRRRADQDLAREMAFHLEMQAEENRALGMEPAEARCAAARQFGNTTILRESSREAWGWMWLDRLGQDIRYALRTVRRNPIFSATTVAVLALGIGGNTAIFSLANALLLNPFPYPEPDRLVTADASVQGGDWTTAPIGVFFAWQEQSDAFEAFAAYGWNRMNIAGGLPGLDTPERLIGGRATASFLRVLRVGPALGRFFTADEDQPNGPPVVLLGYELWQRRFGGSRDVIGRHLTLNGRAHTIVGVMPARLALPGMFACEFWTPAAYSRDLYADTTVWTGDNYVGRLKRGVTYAGARAQLNAILRSREQQKTSLRRGWQARVRHIGADIRDEAQPSVRVLAAAVGLVLLLACVNLAGLLLARGEARHREMAVRGSLGASRRRLVRQMLTESVLLSLCGGAFGLLFAAWGVQTLAAAAPPHLGLTAAVRMDLPVLAFALALSCLTGLLFGLIPALRGSRANLAIALKSAAGAWGAARRGRRTLPLLVVTEIALALVLLSAGGLLMKSFVGLHRVDPGLRPDNVLTFELALNRSAYDSPAKVSGFTQALLERVRTIPGVASAAAVDPLPMSFQYSGGGVEIDGHEVDSSRHAQYLAASAGYFRTMGIPVLLGREFSESDERSGARGLVVNKEFVRVFLPNDDPLLQTMRGMPIIGVIGDVRHNGPAQPPDPQIYASLAQQPRSAFGVAVRTTVNPTSVLGAIRAETRSLNRDMPLYRVRTMEQVVSDSMAEARVTSTTVFGFAIFALALATIGIYGVIAYSVGQRAHEIGLRVALGASRWQVLALMLRTTVWLAVAGVAIGVPTSLALSRFIGALLVDVSPHDVTVLVGVPLLLVAVALAASYAPARRATRINPLDALRCE